MSVLSAILDRILARLDAVVVRLSSPGTWQQLAPVVALAVAGFAWLVWRRAGRTPLGRAVRWWAGMASLIGMVGPAIYFRAVLPDGAAGLVAVEINMSRLGRAQFPSEAVLLALALMGASSSRYLWAWRQSHQTRAEREALTVAWHDARRRIVRGVAWAVAVIGLVVATGAGAGLATAREVPDLGTPGTLWVGTARGANRMTVRLDGSTSVATLAWPSVPLPSDEVGGIAIGPNGETWVGTARGLAMLPAGPDPQWVIHDATDGSIPDRQVFGVVVDRRGVAWVATARGGAAIDPRRGGYLFLAKNTPLMHQILDAVYLDAAGRVWFAGAGGVNVFVPTTGVHLDASRAEVTTATESSRVGGGDGEWIVGLTRYNTDGALPDDLIFAVTSDRQGRMWFGTENGAAAFTPRPAARDLASHDPGNWRTFTMTNSDLIHAKVHAILADRDGRIWFGTELGISILDERLPERDPGRWRNVIAGEGALPNPWVQTMVQTPDGNVWVGTRGGGLAVAHGGDALRWTTYRSSPIRHVVGIVLPWFRENNLASDDVRSLTWVSELGR
jgi:ligand-binding sensor domain-containing protein